MSGRRPALPLNGNFLPVVLAGRFFIVISNCLARLIKLLLKKFAEIRVFCKLFSDIAPGQALKGKKFAEIRVFRKLFYRMTSAA